MDNQEEAVTQLLWDYLKRDPESKDRRQTGWGTKTKEGLAACVRRIAGLTEQQQKLLAPALLDEAALLLADYHPEVANALTKKAMQERTAIAKAEGRSA